MIILKSHTSGSLMRKVAGLIVTVVLIGLGLMFSVLLFAVIVTAGLIAGCYLWWKTRGMRKQLREQFVEQASSSMADEVFEGDVIEGEVIRKVISTDEIER